jgi:UDP:flavonoid glycosyltransferase YjiC (YdhE family)
MIEALRAGIPLLVMPQTVEQYSGARRVVALGAGTLMGKRRSEGDFTQALGRLLTDSRFRTAAAAFAAAHLGFTPASGVDSIVSAIDLMTRQTKTIAQLEID